MGLFSGKTIINVASSVYNMAGDEKDRPIFLQNLIIRNVLSGTKRSMGDTITTGYINGPGIKFRTFFRWAVDNYGLIGLPTGSMYAGDIINTQTVADHIPAAANETIWVQEAKLGESDYGEWADQWMIEHYPDELDTEWEADLDDATKTIKIKRVDGQEHSFVAEDFVPGAKYIFALYTRSQNGTSDPIEPGTPVPLAPSEAFPSTTGYNSFSDTVTTRTETLTTKVTTASSYSDGRPNTGSSTTTTDDVDVDRRVRVYDKRTYVGNDDESDAKIARRDILRLIEDMEVETEVTTNTQTDTIAGGVIRTTVTVRTEDVLEQNNSYCEDTQKLYETKWLPMRKWIYKIGDGINELDNLVKMVADYGQFYPVIPVRMDNKFISDLPGWENQYALAKRAYRKATDGSKYTKLQDELAESKDLKDMDYIYVVYGVSLNVIDKSARRYIYEFFQRLQANQTGGPNSGSDFAAAMAAYLTAYAKWLQWKNSNNGGGQNGFGGHNPQPEPPLPPKPTLPTNEIRIAQKGENGGTDINYDIRISWNFIAETLNQNGKGRPGAKKNDIWLQHLGTTTIQDPTYTGEGSHDGWQGVRGNQSTSYDTMRIYWQYEDNKYRYMDVAGLVHRNYVYSGKTVTITAKEALNDGEESGFLIPLHYATYRAMRLVDSTQMGTACVFLVFNVYEKKKKKWWQSWFFQILFVIVVAIISVVFTGGAGFGLLGAHMAVGSSFGLTGMAAAIAGSIANALAALVLTTLISKLTEGMGTFGAILGAVIGIVVSGAIMNFQMGGGFNFNFADLMKAENILKLLDAAGQGYQAYVQASITDMQNELVKIQEEANAELRRVREAFFEQFGYGGGQIDPMMFVDNTPVIAESRDTFLSRTLMTGSDVAQMSHDMLSDYVTLTTTLPNAFT